jgi:GGDEF domain-containing protein
MESLDEALESLSGGQPPAVLCIDLVGLRKINDLLGRSRSTAPS